MSANWWVFYVPGDEDYCQDPDYVESVAATNDSVEDDYWWTCNEKTIEGDRALLYAKAPISSIVAVLEATTKARQQEQEFTTHAWVCGYKCLTILEKPISLRALRQDKELYDHWGLIRGSFQSPGGKPPVVSGVTLQMLAKRYPEITAYLR